MPNVIRLGDVTDHGGKVVSASAPFIVEGIAVARVGDNCMCPIQGHTVCVIVEGDPNFIVGGLAVAFDGHKTSCGASLISSLSNFGKS